MPYKDKEVQKLKNREYQKKHYQSKKQYYFNKAKERQDFIKLFIERIKRLSKCKCGESRHWILDFHHRENKEFDISKAASKGYSLEKIKKEIRKCDILCSNCHRDLHYQKIMREELVFKIVS